MGASLMTSARLRARRDAVGMSHNQRRATNEHRRWPTHLSKCTALLEEARPAKTASFALGDAVKIDGSDLLSQAL